jgi:pyruvate formate lyase activating enzyme
MDAHRFEGGKHIIDLDKCMGCECINNCGKICPTEAMRQCGIEMDSKEVLEKVLADKLFYGIDGGVTCSGGEPLLQEEFLMEFLPMCKDEGISTCIDTALNVEWEKVEKILPWVDIFLVDLKFMDNDSHMHYTGKGAAYVIDNLHRLSDKQKPVIIRMPLAANVNDSEKEIKQRRRLLNELSNVKRIDIFAVSDHAATKYKSLQREFVSFNKDVDKEIMINNMRKGLEQLNGSDNI